MSQFRVMLVVAFLLAALAGQAFCAGPSTWMDPRMGQLDIEVDYAFEGSARANAHGQGRSVAIMFHELSGFVPIVQNETFEWAMTGGLDAMHLDGDIILPDTREKLPTHWYNPKIGTMVRYKLENDWILGGTLEFGSPSDEPYGSWEEIYVNASLFATVPWTETMSWLFAINYNSNRPFCQHVPLPGVAWSYRPDRTLHVVLGAPFSMVTYRPVWLDGLELSASYLLPRGMHAKAGYDIIENLQVYITFDWDEELFLRADRQDRDDRLFYSEKKVKLGARWQFHEHAFVDGYVGYGFDRRFFEGEDWHDRDQNRIKIADGILAGINVGVEW